MSKKCQKMSKIVYTPLPKNLEKLGARLVFIRFCCKIPHFEAKTICQISLGAHFWFRPSVFFKIFRTERDTEKMTFFDLLLQCQVWPWWYLSIWVCSKSIGAPSSIFRLGLQGFFIVFIVLASALRWSLQMARTKTLVRWASQNLYFTIDVLGAQIPICGSISAHTTARQKSQFCIFVLLVMPKPCKPIKRWKPPEH